MDKGVFSTYSNCLMELIYDFFDIPKDYKIKKYKPIVGGPNSRIHLHAKEGDIFISLCSRIMLKIKYLKGTNQIGPFYSLLFNTIS